MTVYIARRQAGKTTYLIRVSAKTGAVIVAPTYQMVSYIDQMARKLGLKISTISTGSPSKLRIEQRRMLPTKRLPSASNSRILTNTFPVSPRS